MSELGQFADLLSRIPPGTVTAVVRTPLGVMVQDPFSQEPSIIPEWVRNLISVDVYLGPPRPEDATAPVLTDNLKVLGLVAGGLAVYAFMRWRR